MQPVSRHCYSSTKHGAAKPLSILLATPSKAYFLCRYLTLPAVEGNASRGLIGNSTFLSAGATKPTIGYSSNANQCSFGSTYRNAKRGGQYIVILESGLRALGR